MKRAVREKLAQLKDARAEANAAALRISELTLSLDIAKSVYRQAHERALRTLEDLQLHHGIDEDSGKAAR